MRNRGTRLLTSVPLAGLIAIGCAATLPGRGGEPASSQPANVVLKIRMGGNHGDPIVSVRLEDYVYGVVMAESWVTKEKPEVQHEMLKLQALLSRSYAMSHLRRHAKDGFDLCATTHCQVFRPTTTDSPIARLARGSVNETAGRLIVDRQSGQLVETLFHASCGGHTSGAETVWGGAGGRNLRPVKDSYCARAANSEWRFEIDRTRLSAALNGSRTTNVGGAVKEVEVINRDQGARAQVVRITGERTVEVRGEDFRTALTRAFGIRTIKSTRLTVARRGNHFTFAGAGFGHGVGLCQAGALVQVREGRTTDEIVRFYYAQARVEPDGPTPSVGVVNLTTQAQFSPRARAPSLVYPADVAASQSANARVRRRR